MHLESILKEKRKDEMQPQKAAARSVSDEWIGTEEIDEILRQTYYANKRDKSHAAYRYEKKNDYPRGYTAKDFGNDSAQLRPAGAEGISFSRRL